MFPPNPKCRGGQRAGKSPTLRAVAPNSTASETPTTSSNRTTRGSTSRRMADCRRGQAAAGESGAAAAAAADMGECDGGATTGQREAAEGEATRFLPPAHETGCQSPPPPNGSSDGGLGSAHQATENERCREHPAVGTGREGEPRAAAGKEEEVVRKVERVNALEQEAHGGDVVLFRCRGMLSRLQRWVLRTQWDHVGVVGSRSCCALIACDFHVCVVAVFVIWCNNSETAISVCRSHPRLPPRGLSCRPFFFCHGFRRC